MSGALGTPGVGRWTVISLLGAAIACSSSSGSSSTTGLDGSITATGGSAGSSGTGAAAGSSPGGGAAGSLSSGGRAGSSSGGTTGAGGHEVCLICGGAFGAGGKIGSGGASSGGAAGSGTGGVPAFCGTPTTNWLPPMKTCQTDADCRVVRTYSCCGPGTIYGVATSSVPQFSQCFTTTPPQGCPPLGCASQPRTEDNQPVSYVDPSGVEARCVDNGGGTKECTSTLQGSCVHNVTRCAAGDVCSNPCGASCTCQKGYVNCPRPTGTCTSTTTFCQYAAAPDNQTLTSCTCSSPGAPWSCTP